MTLPDTQKNYTRTPQSAAWVCNTARIWKLFWRKGQVDRISALRKLSLPFKKFVQRLNGGEGVDIQVFQLLQQRARFGE